MPHTAQVLRGDHTATAPPRAAAPAAQGGGGSDLLRELVPHLRQHRTALREAWARRIAAARLLATMTREEIFAEATSVYDRYVEALETGTLAALEAHAQAPSGRPIPRGVETGEVIGTVLLLRDVLARSLFERNRATPGTLDRVLDASEPAATGSPSPSPSASCRCASGPSTGSRRPSGRSPRP